MIGGIGVSGDGVDQDDMISFLGVHRAGERLNTGLGNARQSLEQIRSAYRTKPRGYVISAVLGYHLSILPKRRCAMAYRSAITAILLLNSVANNANSNGVPQVEDMCVQPGEQSAERRRRGAD